MKQKTAILAIFIISAISLFIFLYGTKNEAPMDDAYIGFEYIRNIKNNKGLVFNENQYTGIGASTILWYFILASGLNIGINEILFSKIIGILSYFISVLCVFYLSKIFSSVLFKDYKQNLFVLFSTLFFSISGNIIWFSISGMETIMFISLLLMSLVFYLKEKKILLGIVLGLLTLTRLEGSTMLLSMVIIDIYNSKNRNKIFPYLFSFLIVVIPWLIFIYSTTGNVFPTSFSGKRYTQITAINKLTDNFPLISYITKNNLLLFLSTWTLYSFYFVFDGINLPGITISTSKLLGIPYFNFSLIGLVVFLFFVIPLTFLGFRKIIQSKKNVNLKYKSHNIIVIFLLWIILHNISYMVFLPTIGTTSRYQSMNHYLVWSIPLIGIIAIRNKKVMSLFLFLLVVLSVLNVIYWSNVYKANLTHIENVRKQSAFFIRNTSTNKFAAHDIGVVKYYSSKTVVDLGGLIDKNFINFIKNDKVDDYLKNNNVTYLVLPGKHSTEEKPIYDFLEFLKLTNSTEKYRIKEIASFEIDFETWELGFEPTGNYLPSVKVYEIEWI